MQLAQLEKANNLALLNQESPQESFKSSAAVVLKNVALVKNNV